MTTTQGLIPVPLVLLLAAGYLGLLFTVAYYAAERADWGRSLVGRPVVYALSLAVYCTAWTFYGSVGRAASTGLGFLPIYLGPTLAMLLGWTVLRKMLRISKVQRITSVADFIASRYGKSALLAAVVTLLVVAGVVPYIALQLKALSASYAALTGLGEAASVGGSGAGGVLRDPAFLGALALAAFAIVFGTRHLDVTERHEGLVAAVAFESVVKLVVFVAVGVWAVASFGGVGPLFAEGMADPAIRRLFALETAGVGYGAWAWMTGLSMLAVLFLPRQFQMAVVENVDEGHLRKALWLFPLYMLLINLFVLPIAVAGLLRLGPEANADVFVLTVPLAEGQRALALAAFLGGLSAGTSMVVVAVTALSTMLSNEVVMPLLLRLKAIRLAHGTGLTGLLLGIRRVSVVAILLAGYGYLHAVAAREALVSIGLVSFVAVAQLAPAALGGLYWKGLTRRGALAGLALGFAAWTYMLVVPDLAGAGVVPASLITDGPWGLAALRPTAFLGLDGLDPVAHASFWSLALNTGAVVGLSLVTTPSVIERSQAAAFVDVYRYADSVGGAAWSGTARVDDLRRLLCRFLGQRRATEAVRHYAQMHDLDPEAMAVADADLVHYAERLLAGALGAASARVVVASVVQAAPVRLDEVVAMLDEAQQVMAYSRELETKKHQLHLKTRQLQRKTGELEQKQAALEAATRELTAANAQLRAVDRLKDDFVATITHELRTPLTAIRANAEVLSAHPAMDEASRAAFVAIILAETERLTRLVSQVLDLQKLDAEPPALPDAVVDLADVARAAADAFRARLAAQGATLTLCVPPSPARVRGDRDRLMQIALNLLSNAAKFCAAQDGRVAVRVGVTEAEAVRLAVEDNGPGIPEDEQDVIFQTFRQASSLQGVNGGSGLGLAIAQRLATAHGGTLTVESTPGHGATFWLTLPPASAPGDASATGDGQPHAAVLASGERGDAETMA